ncbi:MAG: 50S ribosomal protein L34e [Candidatus ainarchaeum sp.]|nr:50S ribosomal protein L34e [Candidatus ainarchaeum sp.]
MSKKKYLKKGRMHGQKIKLVRGKTAKRQCSICGSKLAGVPHGATKFGVGKLSKTQKKPSVPFGGILCTVCRATAAEEAAKIISGKKTEEIDLRFRPFVDAILKRL